MPLYEAMLWLFGDFHVIGTELIGNTMSSFKNEKSVHRMLFVHSKLGMKYGKKKSFWFHSASYTLYQWSQSQIILIENINIHLEPFGENNLLFKILYFAFINKEAEKIRLLKEWYLLSDCEHSVIGPHVFSEKF